MSLINKTEVRRQLLRSLPQKSRVSEHALDRVEKVAIQECSVITEEQKADKSKTVR
jgi:hypothetical protein